MPTTGPPPRYYRPHAPGMGETAATRQPGLCDSDGAAGRLVAVWALLALGLLAGLGAIGLAGGTMLRLALTLSGGTR